MAGQSFQGGKEELRASILKTYLLRVREEKGEAVLAEILKNANLEASAVDSERAWISQLAALAVLKGVEAALGPLALRLRRQWTTHPEALGTLVRMLRSAKEPVDAYRYLAANAKEATRVGTWELDDKLLRETGLPQITLTYRLRTDADDLIALKPKDEKVMCDARRGELSSYPRVWGLTDAEIIHPSCIAKDEKECIYEVKWTKVTPPKWLRIVAPLGAAALSLVLFGFTGTWISGVLGAIVTGLAAFGLVSAFERLQEGKTARIFEANRIKALERGLDLKGELGSAPVGELAGTVLGGKYRIGRKIGSGGIGVVYAAEHTTLGHEVAVKVLRGAAAKDASEIARLRREAKIQTHIEHPNVARVLDLDQMPDGSIYVVMERLVGKSLADKLGREGVITPGFGIPVFLDVCRALSAAHAKGVVHRDLKPGNIFLCDDGTAKVLDFGMSKLTTAEALTQQGFTLGTPEYMAPEQCIGAPVEARTDLYAFGVLMYESLAGELPIVSANRRDLLDLHQRRIPDSLRVKRPDLNIPEELDRLIMQCLEKSITARPASALALEAELAMIARVDLPKKYAPGTPRRAPAAVTATPQASSPEGPFSTMPHLAGAKAADTPAGD